MKKAFLLLSSLALTCQLSHAQKSMLDSNIAIPFIGVDYAVEFPGADMADRFGTFSSLGGRFGMKLKSNVYLDLKIHYIFSGNVREDGILDSIRTSEGGIIEVGGGLSDPLFEMRGYSIFVSGGYVFPVFGPNPNSGILLSAGMGFMQHRINIDYRDAQIPQLEEDYRKGYDRLSNGFALNQFAGYMHYGKRKLINFFIGVEWTQAWTKNRRGYNFDRREYDNKIHFDTALGIRFGWMIALYRRAPEPFYLY